MLLADAVLLMALLGIGAAFARERKRTRRLRAETQAARDLIDEMAGEHWSLLSVSARALASSLDYRATLKSISTLLVPDLADACVVDLLEEDGRTTQVRCDARPERGTRASRHVALPSGQASELALETIRSGKQMRIREDQHGRTLMVIPLRSRALTLGAITFEARRPGFSYTLSHERLAEQIALHAACAIDNARLYETAQSEIAAREKVLTVISHDLRNPLCAVDISAQLLSKMPRFREEAGPKERALLQTIARSAKRMDVLIRNLLDTAKIRSGTFGVVKREESLRNLLRGYLEFAKTLCLQKEIHIEMDLPEQDCAVRLDPEALFRVFSNVVGNAIKFTPIRGSIRIRAAFEKGELAFSVADSGPGIAKEDLPHIFEDFWQAKDTARLGTGLGLPIAKGIVEAHGGRIWAECPPEGGTIFHFNAKTG